MRPGLPGPAEAPLGGAAEGDWEVEESVGSGTSDDGRCSQAALDFLSTRDV